MPKRSSRAEVEAFTQINQFASTRKLLWQLENCNGAFWEYEPIRRESVQFDHEGVRNIQFNLRVAILETFGPNSPEFDEYRDYSIYSRGPRSVPSVGIRNIPQRESSPLH